MKKYVVLSLLALFSQYVYCQYIRGNVQDSGRKVLPFVNVLLLNSTDSSLVKGTVSDTLGHYSFYNIQPGKYLLSASMVGYKNTSVLPVSITSSSATLQVDKLILEEDTQQLKEITVVEKRPFVEQYMDRMVVNVANSIIASGSTVLEVLEKAPGVTVDRQNDMLQLRGKDGVIVQIDGKQTYLPMPDVVALLRSMPSDNVEQIELITNPSAKYDAAGNSGIINIRLKKNNSVGTNGSVSLGGGSGRYERERGSLQLNHRSKRFNFFGNYSANRGGNYFNLKTNQTRDNGESRTYSRQNTYIRFRQHGHNAKTGVDYFLDDNTTLGIVWTGIWSYLHEDGTAESMFGRDYNYDLVFLQATTDKTITTPASNQVFNINFQHAFRKLGQISMDVDRGWFKRNFSNTLLTYVLISEDEADPLQGLYLNMPTEIKITTFKIDHQLTFASGWKMEAGAKHSYVHNDNDLMVSRGVEVQVPDADLSNHFLYTERVNALYASLTGKLNNEMDVQFGLRAEHTRSEANSLTLHELQKLDYLNLFPSLFLSHQFIKNHSLGFSYSYRIDRPNYQALNPARSYVDPYLFSQGNAYLKPQYTHSLELKHGFNEKIFTSLSASYISDQVFFVLQAVDSILTERTPLNGRNSQVYNLTLTFPYTITKGWNLQTTLMGSYSYFQFTYQDIPQRAEQFSGRLNASNAFVFGKGWTAELSGWLNTPGIDFLFHSHWMGSVDAGIQKEISSQLKAKLSMQDVFHTNRIIGDIIAPGFTSNAHLSFDTQIVMLNLTYTFGNQLLKGIRQRKTGSEEELQRTN
ncbi:outer membrane beta-barrel family protein [Catalinimonas niigatensis]|uniref:outer membrane beta-barrel family protein n=1 Tax=Catalinimonas niigatensis TaxID=1397264 RepID=UPI0026655133|nr:outer membrane beta-barrel family protein [Catalinimonas niigatensis]WPP51965.1 outer membrane beta-barrel family protein [Catalinimonas niigatensis]